MGPPAFLAAFVLVVLLSGCWEQSCVEPSGRGDESCFEHLDGLLFTDLLRDPEEPAGERCGGDPSNRTCAERGFTLECGGSWYRPGSRSAAVACEGRLPASGGGAPDSPPAAGRLP